jgi:divalent metal cation (Fe/Co/Zn/Cd) transporter
MNVDGLADLGCGQAGDACACGHAADTRAVRRLQGITLAWMLVECGVALVSAWRAESAALLAFGADSLVELLSAVVVLMQFAGPARLNEQRAAKAAGWLLCVLAAVVAVIAVAGLVGKVQAETSGWGMAVTAAALVVMPVLGWSKRRVARRMGNRALAADAVQSATCAYLAAVTLCGLAVHAWLGVRWVDPLAALVAVPILIVEARRALRGEACGCC